MRVAHTEFSALPSILNDDGTPNQAVLQIRDNFLSFAEMSNYIGLFGDTSHMVMIEEFRDIAIRKWEKHTGQIIIERMLKDNFRDWNDYLELSQKKAPASVTVKYFDSDYQEQTYSGTAILDNSTFNARVLFAKSPTEKLSGLHMNPVSVEYVSARNGEMTEAAKQACQYYVKEMYLAERTPGMEVNLNPFYKIAQPFKTLYF